MATPPNKRGEEVWVQADGTIRYLEYSAFKLEGLGDKTLTRVSRIIEDAPDRHRVVDEASGKELGAFPTRQAALDFEREHYALNESCSRCGQRFHCGAKESSCWCAALPVVKAVDGCKGCYCPACLRELGQP